MKYFRVYFNLTADGEVDLSVDINQYVVIFYASPFSMSLVFYDIANIGKPRYLVKI